MMISRRSNTQASSDNAFSRVGESRHSHPKTVGSFASNEFKRSTEIHDGKTPTLLSPTNRPYSRMNSQLFNLSSAGCNVFPDSGNQEGELSCQESKAR
jgi:hypothetical protein